MIFNNKYGFVKEFYYFTLVINADRFFDIYGTKPRTCILPGKFSNISEYNNYSSRGYFKKLII